jgi:RHS repeat-associated protein
VRTYDMQARSYRPEIGRFLTADRFESASGDFNLAADPLTQSRYAFAGGNPVSNVEWDGHDAHANYTACRSAGGHSGGCARREAQANNQQANAARGRRGTRTIWPMPGRGSAGCAPRCSDAQSSGRSGCSAYASRPLPDAPGRALVHGGPGRCLQANDGRCDEWEHKPADLRPCRERAKPCYDATLDLLLMAGTGGRSLPAQIFGRILGKPAAKVLSRIRGKAQPGVKTPKNAIADRIAQISGLVGNRGVGTMGRAEADKLGRAWVGPNARIITDRQTGVPAGLIGPTGRFIYRFPQQKHTSRARGIVQANLERYARPSDKRPELNAHIRITD